MFLLMGGLFALGLFCTESRAETVDPMHKGGIAPCERCHAEILEAIGLGEHMGEPLEQRANYSDCAVCHDPHPEIAGPRVSVHQFSRFGSEQLCLKCHFHGNRAKASAMVLPPKGLICAACHISDFTVDDPVTIMALIVCVTGIIGLAVVWFSGNRDAVSAKGILKTVFSRRLFYAAKALISDAVLQRKLFRQSRIRWAIHALIFFPMLVRLGWGIFVAGIACLVPDHPIISELMDKNHPVFGSLLYELTGWLIVTGIVLAVMRKIFSTEESLKGLSPQRHGIFYIFGGILFIGFLVKGMRIAMTGFPDGSETALFSYGIAKLFKQVDHLSELYGFVWYAHAVLVGLFVACLPFSRMFHIVMGPFVVFIQTLKRYSR